MTNKSKVAGINPLLRCGLIGFLLGAPLMENSWSAPAPIPLNTNMPAATENVASVSKSGSEETNKKPKDEGSTQWGFLGSLATAVGSIIVAILTAIFAAINTSRSNQRAHQNELEVKRLSTELETRKDLDLANQKFLLDLQSEYDKDLRNHRIEQYQKLWAHMIKLPKYPQPEPLTVEELKQLSLNFQSWYFTDGGLFLCSNEGDPKDFSNASRERYFDFQEGCRIVLQKIAGEWKSVVPGSQEELKTLNEHPEQLSKEGLNKLRDALSGSQRKPFERNENWTPPDELIKLACLDRENMIKEAATPVPNERRELAVYVVELLRSLASKLRSSMAEDVLTRRSSSLARLK